MNNAMTFAEQNFMNQRITQPNEVKGVWNNAVQRIKRYLYNDLYSVFKFDIPKLWAMPYFRYLLFRFGSIGVIYSDKYGWVFGPLTWTKLDMYYQPSEIYIYNKGVGTALKGTIGVNACIIKCFDDYFGFEDIIQSYAERIANCEKNININIMNSNVSMLIEAENKKQADEIARIYGEATTGKPFVAVNKNVLSGSQLVTLLHDPQRNYIADKLWTLERSIRNEFLTYIGIRNANYDKKERLNSMEVSENNDETSAIVNVVFDNLKAGFDEFNRLSHANAKVELRYNYEEGGGMSEQSKFIRNGSSLSLVG